ncbi:MAG: hypothetical protein F4X83_04300 [Chloroflexi bacterium]|nr:hypothetical protein [Chloroflexota bacterium]
MARTPYAAPPRIGKLDHVVGMDDTRRKRRAARLQPHGPMEKEAPTVKGSDDSVALFAFGLPAAILVMAVIHGWLVG